MSGFPVEQKNRPIPLGIADIKVRRDVNNVTLPNVLVGTIPTDGSFVYTNLLDVSEFNEMILEIHSATLVSGAGAGLKIQLELVSSAGSVTYYKMPLSSTFTANPATITTADGTSVLAAFAVQPPFGDFVRVGFACTAAYTSGSFFVGFKLKG